MTGPINLGRVAAGLADMPEKGARLGNRRRTGRSSAPATDNGAVKKQQRGKRSAKDEGGAKFVFDTCRLRSLRHAFAVASLLDDPPCICRLSRRPGHTLVTTSETYTGHLRKDGAMWRYSRDPPLFGSVTP